MNKPKTPYPYNDKVIAEQLFTGDVNFRILSNEKGSFIDLRRYFYGRPSQKGVRIPFDDFEGMIKLYEAQRDELKLDEDKQSPSEVTTSQVLKPNPQSLKKVKK